MERSPFMVLTPLVLLRLAFHPAGARSCPAQAHTFYLIVPGARSARELVETLHRRLLLWATITQRSPNGQPSEQIIHATTLFGDAP